MRHLSNLQHRLTPPPMWRWPLAVLAGLLSGLVWAELAFLIENQSIRYTLAALGEARLWFTVLFLGLAALGLSFLFHSLFLGNLLTGAAVIVLAFVNYFKVLITMTPLLLGDFSLIGQAGNIATLNSSSLVLRRNSILAIVAGVAWLVVCLFFSRPLRVNWEISALAGAPLCVLALWLVFWTGAETVVFPALDAGIERAMSQASANRACGVPLGLWRSLYAGRHRQQAEDYSLEYMEEVWAQAEDYATGHPVTQRKQPHIILVLSESFFDITQLEGVTFEEDPIADFHALQQESVSGKMGTRSFGYGTCDIELEVLTGMNSGLLDNEPENSWPKEFFNRVPTVPNLLKQDGY